MLATLELLQGVVDVQRLFFTVGSPGELVEVVLDEEGLCRMDPPSSQGGLLTERLGRRFEDGLEATERVGEVLCGLLDEFMGEGEE